MQRERLTGSSAKPRRRFRSIGAMFAIVVLLPAATGCSESSFNTFRTTASDYLETGLNAVADGLIAGLFAVVRTARDESESGS